MANYHSIIPNEVTAHSVFQAINSEVVAGMDGLIITAHGSERMADFFSVDRDVVYKACVDKEEIVEKINANALVGLLSIKHPDYEISIWRGSQKTHEADVSVSNHAFYDASVTLLSFPAVDDQQQINKEYDKWLGPFQPPHQGNRISISYGKTTNLGMRYILPFKAVPKLLERIAFSRDCKSNASGEIQELESIRKFDIDLKLHSSRGLYSVYSEWPLPWSSNYPVSAAERFCSAVDKKYKDVFVSVGRAYLSYPSQVGPATRPLFGNNFYIYNTKTRRSVNVGFEQYSDQDIPVRSFSGNVRRKLKQLGVAI